MKIFAICVVRNEEDIIQYTISKATSWADKVIVYDNGSTDQTWNRVNEMRSSVVIPFKQEMKPYSDGLRAEIFNKYRDELTDNDWWVIQDADEEYEQNPRDFIENQKGYFHHINGKKIDFCFDLSKIDLLHFAENFYKDYHLFNHYTPEAWSEPRAIRHRTRLEWEEKKIWPSHMGLVCADTIKIKHYPLRSPNQIKRRWKTRLDSLNNGGQFFSHWDKDDWREFYLKKAETLKGIDETINPFENTRFANEYKQEPIKRLVKYIFHKSGIFS